MSMLSDPQSHMHLISFVSNDATSFLGNTQAPGSDITVRYGHVADTIIMQCRNGKILLYYSVETFYYRCLDELVSLQKQKLLVATPIMLANQQPLL